MKKIGHSMKYLIVSGDSNTTADFDSISHPDMDFSYPKWPELLGEKLGMKVINMARSAQGNEFTYSTIRDEIVKIEDKSQIGLVIAAWSQAPRKDYRNYVGGYKGEDKLGYPAGRLNPWTAVRVDTHGNLPGWVQKSLGHYLDFQILCERYNIPYVQFQMIELFEHYLEGIKPNQTDVHFGADPNSQSKYPGNKTKDEGSILKMILEYEKKLDTSKFMGWPPVKKLGGWRFKDQLDIWSDNNSPRRVSPLDSHPNGLGHIAICDKINILLQEYKIIKE
jgi:hypothetical protein